MSANTLSHRLAKQLARERGMPFTEALRRVVAALRDVGGGAPLDAEGRAEAYRRAASDD